MTIVWEVAKSDQELNFRRLVPPLGALSLIEDMGWTWTKFSLFCFKIQGREGDNHFTPPPNKPSPCNDGLCSTESISQLCSHAWVVWQAFWCFGAIWITPEADGLLTYGALIKPSWKQRASGNQGWALEGPGWCFFWLCFFFFFRDRVYLFYQKKLE